MGKINKTPKFTIITVCFNSADVILENLDSVKKQTFKNFEHIFIDGKSQDKTVKIINEYSLANKIIISEPDEGIYDAMNKGIRISKGEYIIFLNSDDFFINNTVLEKVNSCVRKIMPDIIYSDIIYVSKINSKKVIRKWVSGIFKKSKLKFGWMPPHPGITIRKSVLVGAGGFDKSFRISGDYDLLLRIFSINTIKIKYLNIFTVAMKTGGVSNNNIRNLLLKWNEDYFALKRNNIGSIFTIIFKTIRKLNQFFKINC